MTKLILASIVLVLSFSTSQSFASEEYPQLCLSHGECQDLAPTVPTSRCLLVKTGTDLRGNITCTVRCYPVSAALICRDLGDSVYGICEREPLPIPVFDPMNPDCTDAVSL